MTKTLLHIDASARHIDSVSRVASAKLAKAENADNVIYRDLADGVPLLNETWVTATFTPPEDRTDEQRRALQTSDSLVAELKAADVVVIGAPLYNFNVPAALKAWIDQIARVGETFAYTENGPKGLLEGKRAIVTIATGGVPLGTGYDFASGYMRHVLGFVGISDVTLLDVEGNEITQQAA